MAELPITERISRTFFWIQLRFYVRLPSEKPAIETSPEIKRFSNQSEASQQEISSKKPQECPNERESVNLTMKKYPHQTAVVFDEKA